MASILKVDELRGIVSAGDITITDGSITMKLQAGVAKAFHGYGDQSGGILNASSETLNISSYEDTATGRSRLNMTNAMAVSTTYMINGSTQGYDYGHYAVSSTKYESGAVNSGGSYADNVTHAVVHGDLA
jgi:hypothetical protein